MRDDASDGSDREGRTDDEDDAADVGKNASSDSGLLHWLVLSGHRVAVATGITLSVFALVFALAEIGVLGVDADSAVATAFGSGILSGTITLVTIALSVNQLLLSRVFGSPDSLSDRLEGTRKLRRDVADRVGSDGTPTDPAAFLSLVGETLDNRGSRLADRSVPDDVTTAATDAAVFGERIADHLESETEVMDAIQVVLGTAYAENLAGVRAVRAGNADELDGDASDDLDAVADLLGTIAVARQFFKTMAIQQDFGKLSRRLAGSGVVAVVTAFLVTLAYRDSFVSIPSAWRPVVVAAGFAVVIAPLALFVAHIARVATIATHTSSVGSFVPPEERS